MMADNKMVVRNLQPFIILIILFILVFTASIAVGSIFIPPLTQVRIYLNALASGNISVDWPSTYETILFKIRLPHAVLITLAGAALASSGAAYQGIFRNPLADPYLIGVASGAGLGAVFAMSIHWPDSWLGWYLIPIAAFIGGLGAVMLAYSLARTGKTSPMRTLILAGVAVSSFATSLTSFLLLRSSAELRRALSYLLGGAIFPGWEPVLAMLPYVLVSMGILVLMGYSLNVLQFGDDQAAQLGLPVERRRLVIIIAASLASAAAVAFAGIIGFIGLIVPHIIRMIWGPDYRRLIILSIFGGSIALLIADLVARVVFSPQVLPVGIITALVGAPFFLWVLRRSRNVSSG